MASERKQIAEQCKAASLDAIKALGGTATRAQIRDEALRRAGFSAAALAVPGPPSKPRYPRLVDYYLSWSLTWLKGDGELKSLGRGMWALADASLAPALVIDVAARHEELTRARRRRRWPWSRS